MLLFNCYGLFILLPLPPAESLLPPSLAFPPPNISLALPSKAFAFPGAFAAVCNPCPTLSTPALLNASEEAFSADGSLYRLYSGIVENNQYVTALRVILVMYVAFLALSFLLGLTDFTQKEAVEHLLKMGVVTGLTSDGGWYYFSTFVLPLCVNGTAQIIGMVSSNTFSAADQVKLAADPTFVISYLDQALASIWFSNTIWIKCLSLAFSSFFGVMFSYGLDARVKFV